MSTAIVRSTDEPQNGETQKNEVNKMNANNYESILEEQNNSRMMTGDSLLTIDDIKEMANTEVFEICETLRMAVTDMAGALAEKFNK